MSLWHARLHLATLPGGKVAERFIAPGLGPGGAVAARKGSNPLLTARLAILPAWCHSYRRSWLTRPAFGLRPVLISRDLPGGGKVPNSEARLHGRASCFLRMGGTREAWGGLWVRSGLEAGRGGGLAVGPAAQQLERPELRKGTGILKVAKKLGVGHSTVARVKASLHHA